MGDAYMNLTDQVDEALRCYEKCLSIDATFAAAHYNRGICRYKLKQYNEALIDLQVLVLSDCMKIQFIFIYINLAGFANRTCKHELHQWSR